MREKEIFKPIPGYSRYLISNYGNIMTLSDRQGKTRLLNPVVNGGYKRIILRDDKGNPSLLTQVHRIVALVFLDEPHNEKYCVHHINGNKLDNYYRNLIYVKPGDHTRNHLKLSPDLINEIRHIYMNHMHNISDIANEFGLHEVTIVHYLSDLYRKYHEEL